MFIHRVADAWVVRAPAKLNLFFEVLAKRADGYHEIESLMCPIDLFDTLCFRENRTGLIELECWQATGFSAEAANEIPLGRQNLVYRAVELLRERAGASAGASLRLMKRIPAQAGLGGGSSDAAAALILANEGWKLGWKTAELSAVAAEIGSDVPFFLAGGSAVCRGRGEILCREDGLAAMHFVVVRPPEGLSTAAVYGICRPAAAPRQIAPLTGALRRGDLGEAGGLLFNRLQPAAEQLSPWIDRLRREFAALDFLGHAMSGSGTSYFGLCRHARHARRLARLLDGRGLGSVFAVQSCR